MGESSGGLVDNRGQHIEVGVPERSYILIEFAAPGSAEFEASLRGVIPSQILAAAKWLENQVIINSIVETFLSVMNAQQQSKIAVARMAPPADVLPSRGRTR